MAANNPNNPAENSFGPKKYFDYVSADFIEDLCSKAAAELDPEDLFSFADHVDSFFKGFGFTDVIISKKTGQSSGLSSRSSSSSSSSSRSSSSSSSRSLSSSSSVSHVGSAGSDFYNVLETLFNGSNNYFVRFHKGAEIETDNENTLFNLIRKEKQFADFIAVRSSDEKVIRAAAGSYDVDLIIPVVCSRSNGLNERSNAGSMNFFTSAGQINHIVAKIAQEKKTAFGFDIYPFLQTKGYRRSKLFGDCMDMIPVLRRYHVPVLLFSGAVSLYDARGAYEAEAFGRFLGLTQEETIAAVSKNPAEILEYRKKIKTGKIIAAGAEIVDDDF